MKTTGTIIAIFETFNVSEKFKKREFVIQDNENEKYPQLIKFEFTQDKCELLDTYTEGEEVEVEFNLRGREYVNPKGEKNYFNTLQAWKLTSKGGAQQYEAPAEFDMSADNLPF